MASAGDEEVEYESDPEEEKRMLSMRRRQAASDDEDDDDRRAAEVCEDDESDGQGGVEEYNEDDDEEYVDDYEEEEEEEEEECVDDEGKAGVEVGGESRGGVDITKELNGDGVDGGEVEGGKGSGEGKKENEPFAVPTAGAFYMHDDRFRDNAAGRGRRMRGGRRLWESKDDCKWGHDKFEEMTMQERQYVERRRTSRSGSRGSGKSRGTGRGDMRGSRSRSYNNTNDRNQAPKSVRGRGPRRYERTGNNSNQALTTQNRQSRKSAEMNMRTSSGAAFKPVSNVGSDQVAAKKQVFASRLNSASPPFYPSGTSGKDISMTQRDVQPANSSRSLRPDATGDNVTSAQNNTWVRGKNVVDSVGMESLNMNDSANRAASKPVANLQMQASASSMAAYSQSPQSLFQGRGAVNTGKMTYQPVQPRNQANRVSTSLGVQNRVQTPHQQMGQHHGSRSQTSSLPIPSVNSFEASGAEPANESNKSKNATAGKGKSSQGSGRGSSVYSGDPIMGTAGNMGVGQGDKKISATSTFLPVMQFGGQHPGGMGVPAFGMAFPGYVGGNSELTWLPVLAGAAGALGGGYCPPQVSVDGSYIPQLAGQTSSIAYSNKESNTSKPNNELKRSEKDESATGESGLRPNKPRRYSEMNFG